MIINHNLQALNTYRQLGINSANGAKTTEKLSSGLRINRAGDDAAGLAISEKMRAQIRGLDQASRNAQDGISMIQTTEGALAETHSILQRMRELAVQSSNDTNVSIDRDELQKEMNQLTSEINRIGNTTEFNTQSLLKGKNADVVAKVAANQTIKDGVVGVPTGALTDLVTQKNSVKAVQSETSVQASTSKATGSVSATEEQTASVAGKRASLALQNGVTFEAKDFGTTMNGVTIKIVQGTTADTASSAAFDSTANAITFTIGQNADGTSKATTRAELKNQLDAMINDTSANANIKALKVDVSDLSQPVSLSTTTPTEGKLANGRAETTGTYSLAITDKFEEAGDTINIGGQTFKAVLSGADASKGEFNVGNTSSAALTGTSNAQQKANLTTASDFTLTTGALTAIAADIAAGAGASFSIGGVKVNITAGTTGTASAISNVDYGNKSVDLYIKRDTDTTDAQQAQKIAEALTEYATHANGGSNELTGLVFSNATNTIKATTTGGAGNVTKFNGFTAAQTGITVAAGTTTIGGQTLNADTKVVLKVDGKEFSIDKAALTAVGTGLDGAQTATEMEDLFKNALASDGVTKLSDTGATVSTVGGKLVVTSPTSGQTSDVEFDVVTTVDADKSALEYAFGIKNDTSAQRANQADSLAAAINANAALKDRFTVSASGGKLTLTENAGKATGTKLTDAVVAGAGSNDKLTITNTGGQNLKKVTIVQSAAQTGVKAATGEMAGAANMAFTAGSIGTELNGVTIKFAGTVGTGGSTADSSWDADSKTLTITGTLADANAALTEAKRGLKLAGFNATNIDSMTVTGGASKDGDDFAGASITFGTGTNSAAGKIAISSADTMAVEQNDGELKIYLASSTPSKNTAAEIQKAVQALGTSQYSDGIDFSKYSFKAEGDWDTKTQGNSITKTEGTFAGGTEEVKGVYDFKIDKAFVAGDSVVINGQTFKAVEKDAVASKGEFNVENGDIYAQAARLADAISSNPVLKANFEAVAVDDKVTIKEKVGSGTDIKATDVKVKATGTQGEYAIALTDLAKDGAVFSIDGKDIQVSDKNTHVGYANGTAIKESASNEDQTKALADAINKNADLSKKYTASVNADGNLVLKQKEGEESATAPDVQYKNSPKGNFTASFQVGANSGQSMTIEVKDMRSAALGISGDGSNGTVAAKDGKVASYVTTANVTDGTTNKNTEFALDISSSEKASAAISVINDAIEQVSGQRSNLGAFQNRLEHTINNLNTSSENLTAAESRIRDVDMAKTVMENTKNSILAQAAQAMLAQANQAPQQVLQLLR